MPSKSKPLSKAEVAAYEARRDLATELLQAVREMKAGQLQVVTSPVIEARKKTGLNRNSRYSLVCRFVPCRGGSKVASSQAVQRARCWPLPVPIPRPCLPWQASSAA